MIRFLSLILLLIAGIQVSASEEFGSDSDLSIKEPPKGEWISLFDGKSLNGWHLFNRKDVEIRSWKVEDGSLVCLGAKGPSGSGDIISDRSFENFELKWEWKVDKGSNSGVFYHIVEAPKYKRAIETSPEYQIIDDINFPAKLEESQKAGADYGMYIPSDKKKLMPVGEWNTSRIIFNKGKDFKFFSINTGIFVLFFSNGGLLA